MNQDFPPTREEFLKHLEEAQTERREWLKEKQMSEEEIRRQLMDKVKKLEQEREQAGGNVFWDAPINERNIFTNDELGIVFEAMGLALRYTWMQQQTNLDFVYKVTDLMKRITPAVQVIAASKQG